MKTQTTNKLLKPTKLVEDALLLKQRKERLIKTKAKCQHLDHDFKNLIRQGRASYKCKKCGADVTLLLMLAQQAGVDLTV